MACQPARFIRRDTSRSLVLRINYAGSAGYAPLLQMRERSMLERAVPGLSVEWKAIPDVGSIHDALANGGVDIASGSPPAFLAAREAGVPARLLAGVATLPCSIIGRIGLRSLAGLRGGEQIAVPEDASFEAAVLELAALRQLGDARALQARVVHKPHAEAAAALRLGRDISAHVSATPYRDVELAAGGLERLVDDRDLFEAPPTASLVYALPSLRERNPTLLTTFVEVLAQAAEQVAADPQEAARLLGEPEELTLSRQKVGEILSQAGWRPGTRLSGVTRIAELWRQTDRLKRTPTSWRELAFAGVEGD
jgi:NitT/TauT family transport system substrate-binding protein